MSILGPKVKGKRLWSLRDHIEFHGQSLKGKLICSWRRCDWQDKLSGQVCRRCRRSRKAAQAKLD